MFIVVENRAGGYARILKEGDERKFHESFVAKYDTIEDAQACLDELAGDDIFVVFYNRGEGRTWIEKHNGISGNIRGGYYPHATNIGEYSSLEEAEAKRQEFMAKFRD